VTPIAIPDEILAAVYAHAIAAFPDECCGYLIGAAPGAVDAVVACRNAQAGGDRPLAPELGARGAETSFAISGHELFQFARSFATDRPARIVYHSHTNGEAYLSTVDRRIAAGPAYPVQHIVVGVTAPAIEPSPSVTPQGFPRAKESPPGFPRAKESRGPHPAIDPSPSVTRGPHPAIDPSPSVTPQGFPRAKESRGPHPAIEPSPSVTQVAQFAWSDAEHDYVEVARWAAHGARG
jgi:proteasome lid subunit RPN8/RPN11